jgi:hypothetical protein
MSKAQKEKFQCVLGFRWTLAFFTRRSLQQPRLQAAPRQRPIALLWRNRLSADLTG